jgi:RNA polymerase sigma-70 factor, ECF subfamily
MSTSEGELLRTLHDRHAGALWSYVVGLTGGDRAKAQDLVQETLLCAGRDPQILEQPHGSARRWLLTVAKRIVIGDGLPAGTCSEYVADVLPERPVADESEHAVDWQLVAAALRTLSAEHRAALLECSFRGSSVAEAAARLGIPDGTVKSHAQRALRLALEEMGGAL